MMKAISRLRIPNLSQRGFLDYWILLVAYKGAEIYTVANQSTGTGPGVHLHVSQIMLHLRDTSKIKIKMTKQLECTSKQVK